MSKTQPKEDDPFYIPDPPPNWTELQGTMAPRQTRKVDSHQAVDRTYKGDRENTTVIHKRKK